MTRSSAVRVVRRHPVLIGLAAVISGLLLWVVFWYALAVLAMIAGAFLVQWYVVRVMGRLR